MPRQELDTGFGYIVREVARHVGVVFLVGATVATVASQITPDALLPRGVRLGISIAKDAVAGAPDAAAPTAVPANQQRVGIVDGLLATLDRDVHGSILPHDPHRAR